MRRRSMASVPTNTSSPSSGTVVRTQARRRATAAAVPRWAEYAAHAVPLCILPSSLWRILVPLTPDGWYHLHGPHVSLGTYLYMLTLSVVSEAFGLLAFGLVRRWGEVVPRWIPLLGGRRVPPPAAIVPATAGVLALVALYVYVLLNIFRLHVHVEPSIGKGDTFVIPDGGPGLWVLVAAYLPLLAWAPLVAALTVAYRRRRAISG